jgi:hypothetical protein
MGPLAASLKALFTSSAKVFFSTCDAQQQQQQQHAVSEVPLKQGPEDQDRTLSCHSRLLPVM